MRTNKPNILGSIFQLSFILCQTTNKMTAIEKADAVLSVLNKRHSFSLSEIDKELDKAGKGIYEDYIFPILDKLIKDGFVKAEPQLDDDGEPFYFKMKHIVCKYDITFEGDLFFEMGGYQGELSRATSEMQRRKAVESIQLSSTKWMLRINFGLLIVGAIAAYYYSLEIYKWHLNHH